MICRKFELGEPKFVDDNEVVYVVDDDTKKRIPVTLDANNDMIRSTRKPSGRLLGLDVNGIIYEFDKEKSDRLKKEYGVKK